MTTEDALKLICAYAYAHELSPDLIQQKNIGFILEKEKQFLLGNHLFKFARGKMKYEYPTPLYYDRSFTTIGQYAFDYERYLRDFDFKYLMEDGYSVDEIVKYYKLLILYPKEAGYHPLRTVSYDVTDLREYFETIVSIMTDAAYLARPADVIFIIDEPSYTSYSMKQPFLSISFADYSKRVQEIIEINFKPFVDFINKETDRIVRAQKIAHFTNSIKKADFSYVCTLDLEVTLNKPIEELPDNFVNVLCKYVAKALAIAAGDLEKANLLYADAQKSVATIVNQYANESAYSDRKVATDYSYGEQGKKHSGLW